MHALDDTLGYLSFTVHAMQEVRHHLGSLPHGVRAVAYVLLDGVVEDLESLQAMIVQHRTDMARGPAAGDPYA